MKEKKKLKLVPEDPAIQSENESYLNYTLRRLCMKFFVKDGGTVNIHIENFMSGIPKDPPPY